MINKIYVVTTLVKGVIENQKHFEREVDAQMDLDMLFVRCYPNGFNKIGMVDSPEYNTNNSLLESFHTSVSVSYKLSICEVF